jgi:hypothetical protein
MSRARSYVKMAPTLLSVAVILFPLRRNLSLPTAAPITLSRKTAR